MYFKKKIKNTLMVKKKHFVSDCETRFMSAYIKILQLNSNLTLNIE